MIPSGNFTGAEVLALPKLNLQFLTFYDYLLKNFTLFRLESTYVPNLYLYTSDKYSRAISQLRDPTRH